VDSRDLEIQRFVLFAVILLTACQRSSGDQTAYMRHLHLTFPTPDPSYLALDYNTQGLHPSLTLGDVRLIRKTIPLVKPCQLPFLRYVFPENAKGMVLYIGGANAGAFPVLWERNEDYRVEDGVAFAVSATSPGPDLRTAAAIQKIGCNS
jgi:hypothetical protein